MNLKEIVKKYKLIFLIIILVMLISPFYIWGNFRSIDNNDFEKISASNDLHLVYIGRPTCGACAELQPKLKKLANKRFINFNYYNTDEFKKNNKDELEAFLKKTDVSYVPVVIAIKNGKIVERFDSKEGVQVQEIEKFIKNNIWDLRL